MQNLDNQKGIEDVLYENGHINSDQLSAIKFEHVNTGKNVEQIIKERGYVSSEDYIKALGQAYGFEFVDLTKLKPTSSLPEFLPVSVAKTYNVFPFEEDGNMLKVAMADPLDLQTIEFIERRTNHKVIPFIATEKDIQTHLEEQEGHAIGEEISAALEEISANTVKLENQGDLNTTDDATIRDAPIARIVGMILETAVKIGASDVHIEPTEDKIRLRYRVDGVLEEKRVFPKEMADPIVARIKILGKMKIDEKRVPLDGRFKVQVGNTQTDLRVSTLPTIYGEKVVMRLLKEDGYVLTFKDLGMGGLSLKRFEEALLKPTGMILVTGPTGSGKTLTNASALSKLNTVRVNIVSIEDPVEIRVKGVNQVQVNPQAGLSFATGLRAFLRQDPNIIFVGEIRDGETAELAIHAALTGHLVLSTLHTNSASGAIPRLLDMGAENFLLASTMNAVLAQRLVRRICENCKEDYNPPEEIKEKVRQALQPVKENKVLMSKDKEAVETMKILEKDFKLSRGVGCEKCGKTGYKGRIGIFELLEMSDKVADMTLEARSADEITEAAKVEGMLSLVQDGFLKVLRKVTTVEEVLRVANE